jgi:hypothetical protein
LDNKKTTNWEKVKYIEIKQMKENRVEKSFLKAAESNRTARKYEEKTQQFCL